MVNPGGVLLDRRDTFPSREQCVLGPLLERTATAEPDRVYAIFHTGESITFADTYRMARETAVALRALGAAQGQPVLVWMPTGLPALRTWFGINLLGGIYVPVNTGHRGRLLEHVIENSEAELMIVHPDLVARLADVAPARLRRIVVLGDGDRPALDGVEVLGPEALHGDAAHFTPPPSPVEPWDTQSIIYSSGTTGLSKGVLSSYLHLYTSGTVASRPLTPDDRYLLTLPLFHAGGTLTAYGTLAIGGSLVVVPAFDTARFWDVVRRHGVTACTLLGAMATFLLKQPPAPDDADSPLRKVWIVPFQESSLTFGRRFGVEVRTAYNTTETSVPLMSDGDVSASGSCGRVRPGVSVRLVDEVDREVPQGEVGELIVRNELPWSMCHGYHRMPEATAAAWRNGWFHTGDTFRADRYGNHYFVDRTKDAIRRRGENISAFEVESELLAHPVVREAAVVPVPSEFGEDDVLAVVAPITGGNVDPVELLRFLSDRVAHFMVPRYVRILPELPKTASAKVEKYRLRAEGITADTWDREAAGRTLKRERLA